MPDDTAKPAEEPKTLVDRIGAALPIALTAIATAFAGLSTSELQEAMFWRSAAAQDQSKASSQWTLAGFKRDRSLTVQATAAILRAQAGWPEADEPTANGDAQVGALDGHKPDDFRQAIAWLAGKGPPPVRLPDVTDEAVRQLLASIRNREPEADVLRNAAQVKLPILNGAIDEAEKSVEQFDREWEPVLSAANALVQDRVRRVSNAKRDAADRPKLAREATSWQASAFEMEQRRYRAEATLNQGVSALYEARVRVSTAVSDRHRVRSNRFFYAMLTAQVGATISSLALARKHRSGLWLLAGLAGLVSVLFGAYVYLGR